MKNTLLKILLAIFGIMIAIIMIRIFFFIFLIALVLFGIGWATIKLVKD